jgi:hypothetical protein
MIETFEPIAETDGARIIAALKSLDHIGRAGIKYLAARMAHDLDAEGDNGSRYEYWYAVSIAIANIEQYEDQVFRESKRAFRAVPAPERRYPHS